MIGLHDENAMTGTPYGPEESRSGTPYQEADLLIRQYKESLSQPRRCSSHDGVEMGAGKTNNALCG
jgi:hypothetical protein